MSIKKPDNLEKYQHYRDQKGVVLVKYGAEWCGPCKRIMPLFEALNSDYKGIFVDVDIDNEKISEHIDLYDIRTVPTFKLFLDGKLEKSIVGADTDALIKYVNRYCKSKKEVKKEVKSEDKKEVKSEVKKGGKKEGKKEGKKGGKKEVKSDVRKEGKKEGKKEKSKKEKIIKVSNDKGYNKDEKIKNKDKTKQQTKDKSNRKHKHKK